jgi:hypothetical protein
MGYDLTPRDESAGPFRFGAYTWPIVLEACGYLWPMAYRTPRWYCAFDADPRFQGLDYPPPLGNWGFEVTTIEALIIARVARNFVAVQRSLPEANRSRGALCRELATAEDLTRFVAMGGDVPPGPWPVKIRDDLTDHIEAFAAWAEASGGFRIG